ncbi:MAG: slipin family protein [Planctomycetaceae bacterium]
MPQWVVTKTLSAKLSEMLIKNPGEEFIIKDTHRGLYYENGKLTQVLEAGRYQIPKKTWLYPDAPNVECMLVDIRERELTIKGQEILTSDKVAIRVSILVQFKVTDPKAAMHTVENFVDRLYSDVQLAARRSLASMSLEQILTNRNELSEEILSDVKESATSYGVMIRRADVKDLIFPGNLQEIMNRVLATERNSQALLVEARTRAEVDQIEAKSRAERVRQEAEAAAKAAQLKEEQEALAVQSQATAEARAYEEKAKAAKFLEAHPALLRLAELETLRELANNTNARLYFNIDRNGLDLGSGEK